MCVVCVGYLARVRVEDNWQHGVMKGLCRFLWSVTVIFWSTSHFLVEVGTGFSLMLALTRSC